MLGLWSMLPQFSYTKLLIVVDDDIDIRDWREVMWAVATRSDSSRDLVALTDTPIDYLDFASPKSPQIARSCESGWTACSRRRLRGSRNIQWPNWRASN